MLDQVRVAYYGNTTPISQVASVSTPDAKTLVIKPWEQGLIPEIEKAILSSQLDLVPQNDGKVVLINIPPLTEERRKSLVKQVRNEAEKGRVGIRNLRKEAKDALRSLPKEGISEDGIKKAETKLLELTDRYIQQINQLLADKEDQIMEV
jgi:ribosome recycling factor